MVNDADSFVRVEEALRLPQSDGRSGDCLREHILIEADSFRPTQRLPDQLCAVFPPVFDENVRRVFFAQRLAVPAVDFSCEAPIVEAAEQLVREGLPTGVRLLVNRPLAKLS